MSEPNATRTLFHPFVDGVLDMPAGNATALFIGAPAGLRLPDGWTAPTKLVQPFRPDYLSLEAAGYAVSAQAESEGHAVSLVLATRHRGLNEARVAEAWRRTEPGGLVVVAGGKTDGIDSLRKRFGDRAEGHLSKHHGVVFWLRKDDGPAPFTDTTLPALVDGQWETRPGHFSHDRIDPASRLLADHLPTGVSGSVADFGAGWGYLAGMVAARAAGLATLDLYEADHAALASARTNLERLYPEAPATFHWRDLTRERPPRIYDLIVCNPPFHAGRAADPGLGTAFIAAASGALKPNGRLLLVANSGLPYEAPLAAGFRQVEEIARERGFKLFSARR
ncbi:MAG: class I SAM-dependent methyltransferase [Rhizobiaceae bacterium]|nr:class I SAM-dependent methyltransferase [Rhizobiaceae bacterium]MCV0404772.1 class I SAM-dependent methyltransferase [Rhizobiaceae bacterium]